MLTFIVDRAVTSKKRPSQNMSDAVDADEIILIDDDDDDDDADDDSEIDIAGRDTAAVIDNVMVEVCAADKCVKLVGELLASVTCAASEC